MSRAAHYFHGLLARRVDGASLAMFRIAFGVVIVWEALRYLWPTPEGSMLQRAFVDPAWTFPYHGFEWVRPWPEPFLTLHFVLLALAGLCLALGLFYRTAAVAVTLLFTYVFLLEEAKYLNHFYLMCLLGLLLTWMPGQACFSLDGRRRRNNDSQPNDHTLNGIPFWPVFLLRAQLFIVYFYAGVAKLNPDWLSGRPLWSTGNDVLTVLSGWLPASVMQLVNYKDVAQWLAVGGLAFDLAIGLLLVCRRTRILAIVMVLLFHAFNHHAFSIGVFPVLAFTSTLIFFEPDWPRTLWQWIRRPRILRPDLAWTIGGALGVPLLGAALGWKRRVPACSLPNPTHRLSPIVPLFVLGWVTLHVLLPLRHYAIPGDAQWTDEGHRFSWRMMLRSKTGYLELRVFDPALLVTGATGTSEINWAEWMKKHPKVLHADVDVHEVNWQRLPELVVLFEPQLGERIVLNPWSSRYEGPEAATQRLSEHWQKTYGREPQVFPTTTIAEALEAIRNDVQETSIQPAATFIIMLEETIACAAKAPASAIDYELKAIELGERFGVLANDETCGSLVRKHLGRTHPFALQGREHVGPQFLSVEDDELVRPSGRKLGELERRLWKDTHLVHLDMSRIRSEAWADLPRFLVYYQEGQPQIRWNHQADLSPRQVEKLAIWPYMIHQYAQRVASQWQLEFGRRPQVYAATSLVMLNSRPPQTLIDPRVDLAATRIKLFDHNDWILPFPYDAESAPTGETAQLADPNDLGPRYRDPSQPLPTKTLVRRFPNGRPMVEETIQWREGKQLSTTTVWDNDGRMTMQAEYSGGMQHGMTTKWHPNGQLAMQVTYHQGNRHGPATTWYENGQKSWEGRFIDGEREGVATAWFAHGTKSAEGEFRAGQKSGSWTTWDETGGFARRCEYLEGEPVAGSANANVVEQGIHELIGHERR